MTHKAKLILVGAGPGAEDLITVRGLEAIRKADVILYDALVDPALLRHARPGAQLQFVGKRSGAHSLTQDEINATILSYGKAYQTIVRLKGGDPFVFGRGYEEWIAATEAGFDVEVIPGVSSAFSVAALLGIPVTHRGYSQSVRIATASTADGKLAEIFDSIRLTADNETTVIFMGLQHLPEITSRYQHQGLGDLPVAVIQSGSTAKQQFVTGTIDSIHHEVIEKQITAPALIVIGHVVSLHPSFQNTEVYG